MPTTVLSTDGFIKHPLQTEQGVWKIKNPKFMGYISTCQNISKNIPILRHRMWFFACIADYTGNSIAKYISEMFWNILFTDFQCYHTVYWTNVLMDRSTRTKSICCFVTNFSEIYNLIFGIAYYLYYKCTSNVQCYIFLVKQGFSQIFVPLPLPRKIFIRYKY